MRNAPPPPCVQRISARRLSAWYDGQLGMRANARLRDHVATCAACKAIIADFSTIDLVLRQQTQRSTYAALRRQERLWRHLRATIVWHQGGTAMRVTRSAIWQGISAAIIIIVLIGAFSLLTRHQSLQTTASKSSVTTSHADGGSTAGGSSVPTVEQIWGSAAFIYHQQMGANNTSGDAFVPMSFTTDGNAIVGSLGTDIDLFTIATQKFQVLYTIPSSLATISAASALTVFSDGRYVVWVYQDTHNYAQVAAYDIQRQQVQTITQTASTGTSIIVYGVVDGKIIWNQTIKGPRNPQEIGTIAITDMTTGITKPTAQGDPYSTQMNWPYLITSPLNGNAEDFYNLATGAHHSLPPSNAIFYTLAGDTIFGITPMGSTNQIQRLIHADTGGDTWMTIGTMSDAQDAILANDRILVFLGQGSYSSYILWDAVQHRELSLGSLASRIVLQGHYMAYLGVKDNYLYFNVIDTSKLP